ncbi:uncharacterized protein TM35_000681130 [Trypanosoma theileri]|uniref:Uncharacterized protein n=1 Tax=Trypanosoma theileri TaxID=67003 RepID=A0A1X0NFW3_9TRYP|nr:uncharacterized protein TM35_000681130 [Trypanosoma theileri]ORC83481.1 hypothetical protein TM35_000681130 [Trypanosoma theileri]
MLSCAYGCLSSAQGDSQPQAVQPSVSGLQPAGHGIGSVHGVHPTSGAVGVPAFGTGVNGAGVPGAIPGVPPESKLHGISSSECPSNGTRGVVVGDKFVQIPCAAAVPGTFVPGTAKKTPNGGGDSASSIQAPGVVPGVGGVVSGAPVPAIPGYPGVKGSDGGSLLSTADAGVGGRPGIGDKLKPGKNVTLINGVLKEDETDPQDVSTVLLTNTEADPRKLSGLGAGVPDSSAAVPGFPNGAPSALDTVPSVNGHPAVPGTVPVGGKRSSNVPSNPPPSTGSNADVGHPDYPGVSNAVPIVGAAPSVTGNRIVGGDRSSRKAIASNPDPTSLDSQSKESPETARTHHGENVNQAANTEAPSTNEQSVNHAQSETARNIPIAPIKENSPAVTPVLPPISAKSNDKPPKKRKSDSSNISSVWVRVPLLIVAVLFSATVY